MLTGKTRHRRGFRGKMVLQVEYQHGIRATQGPMAGKVCGPYEAWRDATWSDLLELERMGFMPYCHAPKDPFKGDQNVNPQPNYARPPPPPPPPPQGRPQSRTVGDWDKQDTPVVPQPRSPL